MTEEWRDIEGFDGVYQISSLGRVRSFKTGKERFLKGSVYNTGYKTITLRHNGKDCQKLLHRLVAETFIPNPENKPEVNHINCKRDDNRVENLEWVTHYENCNNPLTKKNYSRSNYNKRRKGINYTKSHRIIQYDLEGYMIRQWDSISEAARYYGCPQSSISYCLTGRMKTTQDSTWKYYTFDNYLIGKLNNKILNLKKAS